MFNNIENETYTKICKMLFKYHDLMICSIKQLNKLYNAQYIPKYIKDDILDIYENDIYDNMMVII